MSERGRPALVTVKELLEEGHAPVCFERAAGLGGVFRHGETDGVVWDSCRLTSSPLVTSFSDFPVPNGQILHLTVGEYVAISTATATRSALHQHLHFGSTV